MICPQEQEIVKIKTPEEYIKRFIWHEKNCTCLILYLYDFVMINQSDHIRAYWQEKENVFIYWKRSRGMMFEFRNKDLSVIENMNYPYH